MDSLKNIKDFTALDLLKHIKKQFKGYKTSDLSNSSDHIIFLLAQLSKKHTISFFKSIDPTFPGLSFHFVMEARHNYDNKSCALLMLRLSYFIGVFPEKEIFSPMRKRLIHGLLFDDNVFESFFKDVKAGLLYIDSIQSLDIEEKNKLKKDLNKLFFNKYKHSSYFNTLLNNVDSE